jgi:hypothetical protein
VGNRAPSAFPVKRIPRSADTHRMKLELSKVPRAAKLGAIGVLGLLVLFVAFEVLGKSHGSAKPVYTAAPKVAAPKDTGKSKHTAPVVKLNSGLPAALHAALEAHEVVVAVVYGQGAGDTLTTAREAAESAHVGFAALNVEVESIARDMALLAPGVGDPTVLVVRRPGTIETALPGYSDEDTLAQAATDKPPPALPQAEPEAASGVTPTAPTTTP